MVIVLLDGQSDVQRREQGKHIRLNTGNEQLDQVDEYDKDGGAGTGTPAVKYERQTQQAEHHDVTRRDGREQTNHQGEGLRENTDDLHWQDDDPQRKRHAGSPENV